jgi:chromate transporter
MSDQRTPPARLFLICLRLGLTSFGGPVAHLSYFRDELVHRRRWLSDEAYADLVALCQFLPGPASTQVVIGAASAAVIVGLF